ncbi:TPA: adenylosuccinate lyase [Candidatus Poribacteria bacterium]|nr:adenylosuccinate lyase [Candidatus Poribacteria bacterium]
MNIFDTVSPLDYRYYGGNEELFERLSPYVSESAYIKYLLKVETALVKVLARRGICQEAVVAEVERACEDITPGEVYQEEVRIRHNIRALVNCIRRRISEESRQYIHLLATSCDILDTATALRYKDLTNDVILPDLVKLERTLIDLARKNADVVQMGRTHGQHAEPITFGFFLALYVDRLGNRIEFIEKSCQNLCGQFSGAVGAYNAIALIYPQNPETFEREVLQELGLKPAGISSQIVQPEPLTDLVYSIISCFSILADLADDMRHLYRTEIAEVYERYDEQRVGSSTMPHKINPIHFENIKSLFKEFMPRIITIFMDQLSEHQRDLTNSASSRFVAEIFTAFDYAVRRLTRTMSKIEVDVDKLNANLAMSKDSFVAEPIYILLAYNGFPDAYDYTRKLITESYRTGRKLTEILFKDEKLTPYLKHLTDEQKAILQNPTLYTGAAQKRTTDICDKWEPKFR